MGTRRHTQIQKTLAGSKGKREVRISGGRRLDVKKGRVAIEVERSGHPDRISYALNRLKSQSTSSKRLVVPHRDLDKARDIASRKRMGVTIRNISGSSHRTVRKK